MRCDYITHAGSDLLVVNAARVSFDKESEWNIIDHDYIYSNGGKTVTINEIKQLEVADEKLIKYLANHNHWTPFSHCTITIRETVPIFVARQRFKHMVGFTYNEVSRRYVDDTPEFFEPTSWRVRPENVKQGSQEGKLKYPYEQDDIFGMLDDIHFTCLRYYKEMLEAGVAPEQARMVLPQSMYTSYYVTGSLYAWARAYKLRSDPHAQLEIQTLAKEWDTILRPLYPVSWSALVD